MAKIDSQPISSHNNMVTGVRQQQVGGLPKAARANSARTSNPTPALPSVSSQPAIGTPEPASRSAQIAKLQKSLQALDKQIATLPRPSGMMGPDPEVLAVINTKRGLAAMKEVVEGDGKCRYHDPVNGYVAAFIRDVVEGAKDGELMFRITPQTGQRAGATDLYVPLDKIQPPSGPTNPKAAKRYAENKMAAMAA